MSPSIGELAGSEALLERTEAGSANARLISMPRPTVLLGRRQDETVIDQGAVARLGWEVRRRITPGGLVYMDSSAVCLEVALPASHPHFIADVVRAARWFGRLVIAALQSVGIAADLAEANTELGPGLAGQACFGSWVRGEVLLGGRKVFGTAQYRRRSGALFQGVGLTAGSQGQVAAVLAGSPEAKSEAAAAIDRLSASLRGISPDRFRDAIRTVLVDFDLALSEG